MIWLSFVLLSFFYTPSNAQNAKADYPTNTHTGIAIEQVYQEILSQQFKNFDLFQLHAEPLHAAVNHKNYQDHIALQLGDQYHWPLYIAAHDMRSKNCLTRVASEKGVATIATAPNITYKGFLKKDGGGEARLSITPKGLMGFVTDNGTEFFIEPLKRLIPEVPNDYYIVYAVQDVITQDVTCGANDLHLLQKELGDKYGNMGLEKQAVCQTVELATAGDFLFFQNHGTVMDANAHIVTIMNLVEPNYAVFEVEFTIVEQFIVSVSGADPWSATTVPGDLLSSFSGWGGTGFSTTHDLGKLWTGRDLDGTTKGIAWVGAVCTNGFKYSLDEDYTTNFQSLRVLAAHELGHNFGSSHDGSGALFIMAPSVNPAVTDFSAASQTSINNHLASRTCLSVCVNCPDLTGVSVTATNNTTANITWINNGAADYNVRIREAGTSPWTTDVTVSTNAYTATGLAPCTQYEVSVRSDCGTGFGNADMFIFSTSFVNLFNATVIVCDPSNATYDLELVIEFLNGGGGGFTIYIDGAPFPQTYTSSPQTVVLTGLAAIGPTNADITIEDNNDTDCSVTAEFEVPPPVCGCIMLQSENFDNNALPSGWANNAAGANPAALWSFGPGSPGNPGTIDGTGMAYFDDDDFDNTGGEVVELLTPSVDLSNFADATITFTYNHRTYDGGFFATEVWDGAAWVNVLMVTGNDCGTWGCAYTTAVIDVTAHLNANFQVKFIYDDGNGWQWYVGMDNYELCATPNNPNCNAGFTYAANAYCGDEANPIPNISGEAGGTFSATPTGIDINASTGEINLANTTPDIYQVFYTLAACQQSMVIDIKGLPDAGFSGLAGSYCDSDGVVTLTPNVPGGTFSGTGINGSTFDPRTLQNFGVPIDITYTVSENGCSNSHTQSVIVYQTPNANFNTLNSFYWSTDNPVALIPATTGGTFSGQGVSASTFDPAAVNIAFYGVPFSISHTITQGDCVTTISQTVAVIGCLVPTGFNATNSTGTTVALSWNAVNFVDNYDLRYRPAGGSVWTDIEALGTTNYTVSGLASCTEYEFQVAAQCGDNNSGYSPSINATTTNCGATTVVQISVLLEGAYAGSGTMHTALRDGGYLPLAQPYFEMPWLYNGGESVANVNAIPASVVDWVLVEIRSPSNPELIIAQKAAFLLIDGSIIDADGLTNGVRFMNLSNGNQYRIVVRHRNHLDVISATTTVLPNEGSPFDFTLSATQAGGTGQLHDLGDGYWGMHAGDIDGNGVMSVLDFNIYSVDASLINGYYYSDLNVDKNVTIADLNLYQPNASLIGSSEIRY